MATLNQLTKQRAALDVKIARLEKQSKAEAYARIRAAMLESGITLQDLIDHAHAGKRPSVKTPKPTKPKAAKAKPGKAKFTDPDTGATWSGHGRRPLWFVKAIEAGKPLAELSIVKAA